MSKTSEKTENDLEVGSEAWLADLLSKRYTKEWQKDVLALLDKDELIENYPSTDGLSRLTRLIFGEYSSYIDVAKAPTHGDRSATVVVRVIIDNNTMSTYSGAADVYEFNTKSPYNKHPVATAETKALGRALKKLLGLKVHTHEEMMDDEFSYEKLSEQQVRAVENLAKKLNVELEPFLQENAGVSLEVFKGGNSGLSKEQGLQLLNKLNDIQNGKV